MEKNDKRALLETNRILPEGSALDYSEADLTEDQAKAILYGDGRMDMQTIGTDQFITKENEGGF